MGSSAYDIPKRNYFLSLFLKSNTDGQKRTRNINAVVCLDVSGSMNSALDNSPKIHQAKRKSRISLSREAIWMLYERLQPNDIFCLVTFHDTSKTIIKSTLKSDLIPE